MSLKEIHLCMGCMSPLDAEGHCAASCGYDVARAAVNPHYLQPGRWISERYLVGKLTSCDPEGAWYVGYDKKQNQRIWVREYAPRKLMHRNASTGRIEPLPEMQAQYKALLADFDDLCRSIMRLPQGEKVIPILDMVYTDFTIYAIYRYIRTISLESFLNRSGGKLPWRHTKKLLMPLYHTVANVHKAGLIHRGISPQTVLLDQSGALWLSCFSLAAARTHKSELAAQLYPGYAAPEQYHLNSWQGAWTDVYALGAITYRALQGVDPPSANDRVYGDDLLERLDGGMTELVMTAINKALAVEVEDRTQTAETLIAELLANEGSNTAVYAAPVRSAQQDSRMEDGATGEIMAQRAAVRSGNDMRSSKSRPKLSDNKNTRRKKKKRAGSALLWFLSVLVATACLAGFVSWLSTNYLGDLLFPQAATHPSGSVVQGVDFASDTSLDENIVPRFVGANVDSIQENAALMRELQIEIKRVFNSEYGEGVVFEQQPVEGSEMPSDKKITLFVSKGTEMVKMPVVVNLPLEDAENLLKELEIKYQVIEVFNNAYEPDVVVKCDREPDSSIDKEQDTVILYIKKLVESSSSEEDVPSQNSTKPSTSSSKKSSSSSGKSSSDGGRLLKPKN